LVSKKYNHKYYQLIILKIFNVSAIKISVSIASDGPIHKPAALLILKPILRLLFYIRLLLFSKQQSQFLLLHLKIFFITDFVKDNLKVFSINCFIVVRKNVGLAIILNPFFLLFKQEFS
jgi:hypothetical protein